MVINDVDNLDYFCWLGSFQYGYNTCIVTYTKYPAQPLPHTGSSGGGNNENNKVLFSISERDHYWQFLLIYVMTLQLTCKFYSFMGAKCGPNDRIHSVKWAFIQIVLSSFQLINSSQSLTEKVHGM